MILPASGWQPRPYQRALWRYLERGGKRATVAWHRRAGKDDVCLHFAACAAHERVASYWHMLPEAAQARKAIWDAVNPHTGRKRIDEAFPRELRRTTRNNEMIIEFKNGSTWQVVGSDNYNSLVGSAPAGIVASEWALADPAAGAFLRPILLENNGFFLKISTPRGRNHFKTEIDAAIADPDSFGEVLPATATGVFSPELLASEEAEYLALYGATDGRARFRQEYLCDFDAAVIGAYYAHEVQRAEADKRIRKLVWNPRLPVHTAWDLGRGASNQTSVWMWQRVGQEIHLIDFECGRDGDLAHYVKALATRPYTWGTDLLPHDAEPKRLQTGESVQDTLRRLGRPNSMIVPLGNVADGINAVRALLPRAFIDDEKCKYGLDALRNYRREWDAKLKVFKANPLHDWCSDPADALRMLAMGEHLVTDGDTWGKPIEYQRMGIV